LEEQREARRHREAGHLFADGPDRPDRTESRSPVGERLGASRRLVVLGDPGGGKTTMLRWMATAMPSATFLTPRRCPASLGFPCLSGAATWARRICVAASLTS
jgi:predicted NACHT family NTPase